MIILEPHADDAFLSYGSQIKPSDTIVTVYATPKRAAEAKAYADSLGCSHIWLGYTEAGSMDAEAERIELPEYPGQIVLAPLGLRHKEHYEVHRAAVEKYVDGQLLLYVDQPYALQCGNSDELDRKLTGRIISSVKKPHGRKYAAKKFFKSQSKFFYFGEEMIKWITEITVT